MRLFVAVGIHPEHASKHPMFLAEAINNIRMLKKANQLHAVGEMGLDASKPIPLVTQERLLLKQLPLVAPLPLILHVRGESRDESGDFIYKHCLNLLIGRLDRKQKIQLHSFSGSSSTVENWLVHFPNTFFSFSGLMARFSEAQIRGLKSVPVSNILFETDSPYLKLAKSSSGAGNHPTNVGEIIRHGARMREESFDDLNRTNSRNSRGFFGY